MPKMDGNEIKVTIELELERRGIVLAGNGPERKCLCPFHSDSRPSLRVNVAKQLWKCDPCDIGGGVIKLVMLLDGISGAEARQRLTGSASATTYRPRVVPTVKPPPPVPTAADWREIQILAHRLRDDGAEIHRIGDWRDGARRQFERLRWLMTLASRAPDTWRSCTKADGRNANGSWNEARN